MLNEIEAYFATHEPKDNIRLDTVAVVTDGKLFVNNTIQTLKRNKGNKTFDSDYQRLLKYYEQVRRDSQ